ncbi:MAG: UDP-N-acetylmuramoyl-tripeptide--D-alanyl-D-alanine ligase, partial [Pseudomonadota bacterium]
MMTLAQAHALLPGSTVLGSGELAFTRVHTDTRSIEPGDLFVALRGERFDGHEFIAQARARGAVAVLASSADALGGASPGGLPGLLVADTLAALQQLAQGWRHRFHLPLVAVAGSNGKTTVTQMVAAILRAAHGSAMLATAGNLNNHIGVPLTLLRLRQDDEHWHRAAVVELGMNHPGEMALLAALAQPTVALVNNAQREHQEFMKSVEAVADENGAVIDALPAGGTVVIPADDAFTPRWRARRGAARAELRRPGHPRPRRQQQQRPRRRRRGQRHLGHRGRGLGADAGHARRQHLAEAAPARHAQPAQRRGRGRLRAGCGREAGRRAGRARGLPPGGRPLAAAPAVVAHGPRDAGRRQLQRQPRLRA